MFKRFLLTFNLLIFIAQSLQSQEIPKEVEDSILTKSSKVFWKPNGVYAYSIDGMLGFRTDSSILTYPIYNQIIPDKDWFMIAEGEYGNSKAGWADSSANIIITPIYDYINRFDTNPFTTVRKDSIYGFLTRDGQFSPTEYSYLSPIIEDVIVFKNGEQYGIMDRNKEIIIDAQYEYIYPFTEGLAGAKKDGKWGFIDQQNQTIIPFIYEKGSIFSEGLACMKKDGKWGYINQFNQVVIPFKYTDSYFEKYDTISDVFGLIRLSEFDGGYAKVFLNGKEVRVYRDGTEKFAPFF